MDGITQIAYNPATDPKQYAAQGLQGLLSGILENQMRTRRTRDLQDIGNWAKGGFQGEMPQLRTNFGQQLAGKLSDPLTGLRAENLRARTEALRKPSRTAQGKTLTGRDFHWQQDATGKWTKTPVPAPARAAQRTAQGKTLTGKEFHWQQDPVTGEWKKTPVPVKPTARGAAAPASKVVGGDLYERNPDTGQWELKVDVPEEAKAPDRRVIGGDLYELNAATGQWELKVEAEKEAKTPASKVIGGKLYERNPTTGKWELQVEVPGAEKAPTTRTIGDELYEYNPTTKKWESTGVKAAEKETGWSDPVAAGMDNQYDLPEGTLYQTGPENQLKILRTPEGAKLPTIPGLRGEYAADIGAVPGTPAFEAIAGEAPTPSQEISQKKLDRINRLQAKVDAGTATKAEQAMLDKMLAGQPLVEIGFGKPASASERTAIAEARASMDALNNLKTLFDSAQTKTGPITGRILPFLGLGGFTTDEQENFMAATSAFKNAVIKQITGAQMSEVEAKRIMKQIPDITDPPARWEAKWEQTMGNIQMMEQRRLQILRQSGLRVPTNETIDIPEDIQNMSDEELKRIAGVE